MYSSASPNAPGPNDATLRARITHPFHPLLGEEIVVVDQRCSRHGDRVWFQAANGHVRSVARAWTSLAAADPFEVISAGRACFRPKDLLQLAALLDGVRSAERGGVEGSE